MDRSDATTYPHRESKITLVTRSPVEQTRPATEVRRSHDAAALYSTASFSLRLQQARLPAEALWIEKVSLTSF